MPSENTYTQVTGTRLRETEKAVQFRIVTVGDRVLDESKTIWFPFSQIKSLDCDPHVNDTDTVEVADWILQKQELI